MHEELEKLIAEATPGPWGVWRERINGPEGAIRELTDQVRHTSPVGDELVMIDAGGKCPAITGCGPTSDANADLIVFLVNNAPAILEALTERASMAAEIERLKAAIKIQASAVRTLQANEDTEINILRKQKREWHQAVSSLDSERDVNEILTAEIERLRVANGILEDGLQEVGDDYPGSSCQKWCQHQINMARAALEARS